MKSPDIIGKKILYFILSGLVIVPGIISLALWGIRPAIDFTGGTTMEVRVENPPKNTNDPILIKDIEEVAKSDKIELASVQVTNTKTYLLRMKPIDKNQTQKLESDMNIKLGQISVLSLQTVGPTIGAETTLNAVKSVLIASLAIIIFIAFAFRKIHKPYSSWKFGICAVIALVHDVLVVVGIFSIMGHFFNVEVDSLFITALLTVMGFSVHDTIVVFDRIRENLHKMPNLSFADVTNESIVQTLARSLSTSLTVLFTLFALLLFGGETIRWFIVALLIGIASGTYSSIFNASPLLVLWEEWGQNRKK